MLIDAGHGIDTSGKRSPDGQLREYKWAREIARQIVTNLRMRGHDAEMLVTEDADISLGERCRRVNAWCNRLGKDNVILISIHANAAGAGDAWKSAGGWSVYTSPGRTKSDILATDLWNAADRHLKEYKAQFRLLQAKGAYDSRQKPMRTDWSDGDPDYEARFYILMNTQCPAVLTESLFQDNKADVDFMLSPKGKDAIVSLHVEGIISYLNNPNR